MPKPITLTVHELGKPAETRVFERDLLKVGRLSSAHLRLDDAKVSRIHAVIEASGDGSGYSLIDMGSAEGTLLNGKRTSKAELKSGDEIRIGDVRIRVAFEGRAAVQAQAPNRSSLTEVPAAPVPVSSPLTPALGAAALGSANAAFAAPASPAAPAMGQVSHAGMSSPQAQAEAPSAGIYVQTTTPQGTNSAWGTVPNTLASKNVPHKDRVLEVRLIWGDNVLDTVAATDKPVTLGHEKKVVGWGPFQQVKTCDLQFPPKLLPSRTYLLAEPTQEEGTDYIIHLPPNSDGHVQHADGRLLSLAELQQNRLAQPGEVPGQLNYHLEAEETLLFSNHQFLFQIRYVRKNILVPPPWTERINYTWLNILLIAFFLHAVAILSFVARPETKTELTEDLFKNTNRFAQFRLTPEQKKRNENNLLKRLKKKGGSAGAKARGKEGKAGRKDYKGKKQGRMAVKGDPSKKEIAKSALNKLFGGGKGAGGNRSYLFGSGGLGGELKGALGGVTGSHVGDARGLGGLGTRGVGGGGGGLSMNSVGLGALGTHGRGTGDGSGTGYGEGAGRLGRRAKRDINISPGTPVIMGSLDKEIIHRVIRSHMNQIRYCYEKELQRSPGLFGKVATEFVISAQGSVSRVDIKEASLQNAEVHRCIQAKIRTWRFPKPKGGGIVIVKYPFIFKTSG